MVVLRPAAPAHGAGSDANQPDSMTEAIVVKSTRPTVRNLIDRKVYEVSVDLQSTMGTAADVLNKIPSVEVDADGAVSLRGNTKVTILVDGKPSAELTGAYAGDGLLNFPASDIERIEVLNNPPPQFKAEGSAGVINIITRKDRKPGRSSILRANAGNKSRYGLGASGSYNKGPLSVSGGVNFRHNLRERMSDSTLLAVDPATNAPLTSTEDVGETLRKDIPSVKGSIDYKLNSRQTIGLSLSERAAIGTRSTNQSDFSMQQDGTPVSATERQIDGHERRVSGDQTLRFNQVLRTPWETLDFAVHHTAARSRDRYAYDKMHVFPESSPTFEDLYSNLGQSTTELSADYALPLSRQRTLKLGYDFERDGSERDRYGYTIDPMTGLPVANPATTNAFQFVQKVHSVYGTFQSDGETWGLQLGARVERTALDTLQVTNGIRATSIYTRVYPNLHLERIFADDSSLAFGASRRVTRPDAQSLNPFVDTTANHLLVSGNQSLVPEDTHSFEIAYRASKLRQHYDLTAYLHQNRDNISDLTTLVNADTLLTTKVNLSRSKSGGLEFTLNGPIIHELSYSLSGNFFYSQIDATGLGSGDLKSTTGLNAKAGMDYQPTPDDTLQFSYFRSAKRLTPQGYIGATGLVNLGYKRQMTSALSFVATVSDAFDGQRYRRFISTPTLTYSIDRLQVGRVIFVGVVYRVGSTKKEKNDGEKEEDE
jgi:outer membrane receptor for ferrienterochelin and colicin